jgi:hypothetical protein
VGCGKGYEMGEDGIGEDKELSVQLLLLMRPMMIWDVAMLAESRTLFSQFLLGRYPNFVAQMKICQQG